MLFHYFVYYQVYKDIILWTISKFQHTQINALHNKQTTDNGFIFLKHDHDLFFILGLKRFNAPICHYYEFIWSIWNINPSLPKIYWWNKNSSLSDKCTSTFYKVINLVLTYIIHKHVLWGNYIIINV